MTPNVWDAAKAVLRGKFIAIKSNLKKQEESPINNLTLKLKQLEKEQKKPKVSKWKEIIKLSAEINKMETKKTIAKINKTKSLFSEKIKLTNLQQIHQEKRERIQINKIRNEKGEVTTDTEKYKGS